LSDDGVGEFGDKSNRKRSSCLGDSSRWWAGVEDVPVRTFGEILIRDEECGCCSRSAKGAFEMTKGSREVFSALAGEGNL
jgi:hypothetical protein